ncbi:hypothetical protein ACTXT7_002475 [Hymenolepis weldensis]
MEPEDSKESFGPKTSNEAEPVVNAVAAPNTYHIFYLKNPKVWFRQLENIIDIFNKAPEENPYDTFKRAVISCPSDSQEKFLQLLSQVELGDRISQPLHHMRFSRCPVISQQPDVLTKLLAKLELLGPNTSLQHGSRQRPCFLKRFDSSSKHRNQICYYHKTYGDDAKKYSNPLKEDIHDFLLEHATIPRKTRDKRRRKTPKPIAANQQKPSQSATQRQTPNTSFYYKGSKSSMGQMTKEETTDRGSNAEFTTLPGLIKGISRVLEHSGKYGSTTDREVSKCGCAGRGLPSQSSISIPTP